MLQSKQAAYAALHCPGLANLLHHSNSKRCRVWPSRHSTTLNSAHTHKENDVQINNPSSIALGSDCPSQVPATASGETSILPSHVAVIMDGNSRWARQRGLPRFSGHQTGVEAMRRTVQFCCRRGIQCLTVFALSTENWQRETEEVEFLLKLIQRVVNQELDELIDAGVQMHFIGDRSRLSPPLIKQLQRYILFY